MKRLIALSIMLVVLVALTSGACLAVTETLNILMIVNPDVGNRTDSKTLDLMTTQSWSLACIAETQLYGITGAASLDGNYGGKVWKFEYSLNNSDWFEVATLVSSSKNDLPGDVTVTTQPSTPKVYWARYLKVSYDATLSTDPSTAMSAAGGYGTIEATAVPEPSSAVALATGVVGIIGLLRRRKS